MIHGYSRFTRIRVEPGPHGPEHHIDTEGRDLSAEEALALRTRILDAMRDPERARRALVEEIQGGRPSLLTALFPEAKAFIDEIRSRSKRGA